MAKGLGEWVFVPFAIVLVFTFGYVALFLPETSGRTHEEILRTTETIPKDENSSLVMKRNVVHYKA